MNSYGDGNTYRGTVCKDSEVPTIITDGKTAYSGKNYLGSALRAQKLKRNQWRKHLLDILLSFLAGLGLGLCFGIESFIKWLN